MLEEGDGDEVQSGDNVTLHYQGTSWDTGEVFDQSYGGDPAQFTTDAGHPGLRRGARRPEGRHEAHRDDPAAVRVRHRRRGGELAGQTLVFLVEIIDTAPATDAQ